MTIKIKTTLYNYHDICWITLDKFVNRILPTFHYRYEAIRHTYVINLFLKHSLSNFDKSICIAEESNTLNVWDVGIGKQFRVKYKCFFFFFMPLNKVVCIWDKKEYKCMSVYSNEWFNVCSYVSICKQRKILFFKLVILF